LAGRTWVPARSHSVGGSLSPSKAIGPQIQIGKPTLPKHGAIASQAGDGDCERLPQTSKTGEGRAPVRSAELQPGDRGIAAVPADDLPGERVGLDRPGDSQLITSRPNKAEGIPTRASGTALGGAGSASMPVTAGCRLTAHADTSDPSDDPSLANLFVGSSSGVPSSTRKEMRAAPSQDVAVASGSSTRSNARQHRMPIWATIPPGWGGSLIGGIVS